LRKSKLNSDPERSDGFSAARLPNRSPFDHSWLNKLMSLHKNWSIIENALHAKTLPFEIRNNVEKAERWAREQAMSPEQRAEKQAKAEARKAAKKSESDAESEQPTDAEKEALRAENARLRRKLAESEAEKAKLREELSKKSARSASADPPDDLTPAELARVVAIYNRWTDGTTPGERDSAKGIFAGLADKFGRTIAELIAAVKASGNNYDRKAA
jgi:hypothetical protein